MSLTNFLTSKSESKEKLLVPIKSGDKKFKNPYLTSSFGNSK